MVTHNPRKIETVTREQAYEALFREGDAPPTGFNYSHDTGRFEELKSNYHDTAQTYVAPPMEEHIFTNPGSGAPALEPYLTPDQNPRTFRPQLYTETLEPTEYYSPPAEELQKIAEIEMPSIPLGQSVRETEEVEETSGVIKLNTRGLIAVASFFAVLALVTVLIIINAVSINASGARIDQMRMNNSAERHSLNQKLQERDQVWNDVTNDIREQLNANGQINGEKFEQVGPPTHLPPIQPWQPPANHPDHSTNWFDAISRWLSGLFR